MMKVEEKFFLGLDGIVVVEMKILFFDIVKGEIVI